MRLDGPYKSHLPEFDGVKEVDPDIMMQLAYFGFKPVDARAKIIQNVTSQEVLTVSFAGVVLCSLFFVVICFFLIDLFHRY